MRLFDLNKGFAPLTPFIHAQISSGVRGQTAPGFGCEA